jgi:hypothetical protein
MKTYKFYDGIDPSDDAGLNTKILEIRPHNSSATRFEIDMDNGKTLMFTSMCGAKHGDSSIAVACRDTLPISPNVKAHPPLPARAKDDHRVEVEITGNHRNRAAGSGWMTRLVRLLLSSSSRQQERQFRTA